MKLFKINTSFFVYINANDEYEAEKIVIDTLQPLVDDSEDYEQTDFYIEEVPKDEDYRYEIYNKDGHLVEGGDGYVCLEEAIERALESGGEYIKQMWYPIGTDGELIVDDCSLIGSDVVWEKRRRDYIESI